MYKITGITSDPLQKQTLILPSGKVIVLTIYFIPQQYCWVIRELNYDNSAFVINGIKITTCSNMLHQYKNKIPFGLSCVSNLARDPQLQEDFSSGSNTLYVLTSDEVTAYMESLSAE